MCSLHTGILQYGIEGKMGQKNEGRIERSTSVLSLWKFCKACRRGWVVWSDMDLTSTELKPLAHFYEELGDQCLNRPYLVSPGTFFHPLLFLHCVSVITVFLMFTFLATFVFFSSVVFSDVVVQHTFRRVTQKCSFPTCFTYLFHCCLLSSMAAIPATHSLPTCAIFFISKSQLDLTHSLGVDSPGPSQEDSRLEPF